MYVEGCGRDKIAGVGRYDMSGDGLVSVLWLVW